MKHMTISTVSALLLLGMLASCGSTGGTQTDATETAVQTATATEVTTESGPVFPEVSYGGEDIHFLTEECTFGDMYTSIEI